MEQSQYYGGEGSKINWYSEVNYWLVKLDLKTEEERIMETLKSKKRGDNYSVDNEIQIQQEKPYSISFSIFTLFKNI